MADYARLQHFHTAPCDDSKKVHLWLLARKGSWAKLTCSPQLHPSSSADASGILLSISPAIRVGTRDAVKQTFAKRLTDDHILHSDFCLLQRRPLRTDVCCGR